MPERRAARLYDDPVSNPIPTLQVDKVSVKLGGAAVVKEVSFELRKAELALLSSPNGTGKSTLLRAIVSLLPFAGESPSADIIRQISRRARSSFSYPMRPPYTKI